MLFVLRMSAPVKLYNHTVYGIFMKAGSFVKTGTIKKVSPNYFTGKASLQIISGTPKPRRRRGCRSCIVKKEPDVLHVKFHKGARTKIHRPKTYVKMDKCSS